MRTLELHELVHAISRSGNRTALFLGAGASVSSGIPAAAELVERWRRELHERAISSENDGGFEQWVQNHEKEYAAWLQEHHPQADPDAKRYSYSFERVAPTRAERQHRMAELCDAAMPRAGYFALAALMDGGAVDTILTTNFDDLLADACFDVGSVRPQVSAHTETVRMVRLTSTRPKIIKLHGDYLFDDLQNTDRETQSLRRGMEDILRQVNQEFGLLVAGYGGNDDSIMSVLEGLDRGNPQGLFWCARNGGEPNRRVRELLESSPDAFLVAIDSFDQLMVELFRAVGGDLTPLAERRGRRSQHVEQTLRVLGGSQPVEVAVAQADNQLYAYSHLRRARGLAASGKLTTAEVDARRAVELDPGNREAHTELGYILFARSELSAARAVLENQLDRDPESYRDHELLGLTLWCSGELDDAETHLRRAGELAAQQGRKGASLTDNLAIVVRDKGDLVAAERVLSESAGTESSDPTTHLNMASVLFAMGKKSDADLALQQVVEQLPKEPRFYILRIVLGLAQVAMGSVDKGVEIFRDSCLQAKSPLHPGAVRFLRFMAVHDHQDARQALSTLQAEGLIGAEVQSRWDDP